MITFDKLKIVAPIEVVEVVDPGAFCTIKKQGKTKSMKISLMEPGSLTMELNFESREFILEFTGKILGKDYPELISIATIKRCFDRINELGYCRIDPEEMMGAEVVKCDVTKDVPVDDIPTMTNWIRANLSNYQAYSCRILANKNVIIEKNVCTQKRKKRITIYNKQNEMALSRERKFVSDNDLEGKFDGQCRFELNLYSKKQIRDALGISGNTLEEVLQAERNPIAEFMEEVIANGPTKSRDDRGGWKDYLRRLVLRDCDNDPAKVEAIIRQFKSPRSTNISKMMEPYREILAERPSGSSTWTKEKLLDVVR